MILALKTRNFVSNTRNCVSKTSNFVFKMMYFAVIKSGWLRQQHSHKIGKETFDRRWVLLWRHSSPSDVDVAASTGGAIVD